MRRSRSASIGPSSCEVRPVLAPGPRARMRPAGQTSIRIPERGQERERRSARTTSANGRTSAGRRRAAEREDDQRRAAASRHWSCGRSTMVGATRSLPRREHRVRGAGRRAVVGEHGRAAMPDACVDQSGRYRLHASDHSGSDRQPLARRHASRRDALRPRARAGGGRPSIAAVVSAGRSCWVKWPQSRDDDLLEVRAPAPPSPRSSRG